MKTKRLARRFARLWLVVSMLHVGAGFGYTQAVVGDPVGLWFGVEGPLDDPVLGRLEDVVARRLGSVGVRVIAVERGAGSILVTLPPSVGERREEIVRLLWRPDDVLFATTVEPYEMTEPEGLGYRFDADAFRKRVRAEVRSWAADRKKRGLTPPRYQAFPIYRNPDDWLRPARDHAPRYWFYPPPRWFGRRAAPTPLSYRGTFVYTESAGASFRGREIQRVYYARAKFSRGVQFELKPEPRTMIVGRSVERLVVLNGMPAACSSGGLGPSQAWICDLGWGVGALIERVEHGALQRTLTPMPGRRRL